MGNRVTVWLPEALIDIERLDGFLRVEDRAAADRAIDLILSAADSLTLFPERGRPFRDAVEFRELLVPFGSRGYVLRYRIDGQRIVIVRVWHLLEDR